MLMSYTILTSMTLLQKAFQIMERSVSKSERQRWPTLARVMMNPSITAPEQQKAWTIRQKIDRWYGSIELS